ncbi:MAG: 50S ribosomal protein L4 [Candidatus Kerfeldbacteria bacterium]|nr:50S ribosomal protein L4 [Candidatus Kerfeldbacteria bacterium]
MISAPLYNAAGERNGDMELPEKVFAISGDQDVVYQVAVAVESQSRPVIAHTKTRAEVRGGGRKPWKQKGTGRARHGSIRSPLWVGGGVTFGPRSTRNFVKHVNKPMKNKAMRMVLSDRATNQKILILETLELPQIKTSAIAGLLQKLKVNDHTVLIAANVSGNLVKSSRNIPNVFATRADQLSILDVLSHEYVVLTKEALKILETRLAS